MIDFNLSVKKPAHITSIVAKPVKHDVLRFYTALLAH